MCEDIDECDMNQLCDPLVSNCSNTEGTYSCVCQSGFLYSDGVCHDMNECAGKVSTTFLTTKRQLFIYNL